MKLFKILAIRVLERGGLGFKRPPTVEGAFKVAALTTTLNTKLTYLKEKLSGFVQQITSKASTVAAALSETLPVLAESKMGQRLIGQAMSRLQKLNQVKELTQDSPTFQPTLESAILASLDKVEQQAEEIATIPLHLGGYGPRSEFCLSYAHGMEEALKDPMNFNYGPGPGLPEVRQAFSEDINKSVANMAYSVEQTTVLDGGKHQLELFLEGLENKIGPRGERACILVPELGYPNYLSNIKAKGFEPIVYPFKRDPETGQNLGVDIGAFQALLQNPDIGPRLAGMYYNSGPKNPSGDCHEAEYPVIAKMVTDLNDQRAVNGDLSVPDLHVLDDQAYLMTQEITDKKLTCLASYFMDGVHDQQVCVSSTMGKRTGFTGARIGMFFTKNPEQNAHLQAAWGNRSQPAKINQIGAMEAIRDMAGQRELNKDVAAKRDIVLTGLSTMTDLGVYGPKEAPKGGPFVPIYLDKFLKMTGKTLQDVEVELREEMGLPFTTTDHFSDTSGDTRRSDFKMLRFAVSNIDHDQTARAMALLNQYCTAKIMEATGSSAAALHATPEAKDTALSFFHSHEVIIMGNGPITQAVLIPQLAERGVSVTLRTDNLSPVDEARGHFRVKVGNELKNYEIGEGKAVRQVSRLASVPEGKPPLIIVAASKDKNPTLAREIVEKYGPEALVITAQNGLDNAEPFKQAGLTTVLESGLFLGATIKDVEGERTAVVTGFNGFAVGDQSGSPETAKVVSHLTTVYGARLSGNIGLEKAIKTGNNGLNFVVAKFYPAIEKYGDILGHPEALKLVEQFAKEYSQYLNLLAKEKGWTVKDPALLSPEAVYLRMIDYAISLANHPPTTVTKIKHGESPELLLQEPMDFLNKVPSRIYAFPTLVDLHQVCLSKQV